MQWLSFSRLLDSKWGDKDQNFEIKRFFSIRSPELSCKSNVSRFNSLKMDCFPSSSWKKKIYNSNFTVPGYHDLCRKGCGFFAKDNIIEILGINVLDRVMSSGVMPLALSFQAHISFNVNPSREPDNHKQNRSLKLKDFSSKRAHFISDFGEIIGLFSSLIALEILWMRAERHRVS